MNHKRKRPKNRRAGCLMCKHWKINGFGKNKPAWEAQSSHRSRVSADRDIDAYHEERSEQ